MRHGDEKDRSQGRRVLFRSNWRTRHFTSALSCVEPFDLPALAVTSNVHRVAKFRFAFATYRPLPTSCAATTGPVIDMVGMLVAIFTIAALTGLPVALLTVTLIDAIPCFVGATGLNAAVTASLPEVGVLFMESAAYAVSGMMASIVAKKKADVRFMEIFLKRLGESAKSTYRQRRDEWRRSRCQIA
jgi:hypothetical protein